MSKFSILRDVLALKDISAQQKLVLLAMNQFGDDGRNVYPAIETIAKLASLSPRQTKRHIKTLRLKGYLKPQGKSRNNTIKYALNVPTRVPSRVGPEGRQRPTNNLYNNLDNTVIRDSYINSRNQQAVNIDRFSNVTLPESGAEISIRLQREREARRKR